MNEAATETGDRSNVTSLPNVSNNCIDTGGTVTPQEDQLKGQKEQIKNIDEGSNLKSRCEEQHEPQQPHVEDLESTKLDKNCLDTSGNEDTHEQQGRSLPELSKDQEQHERQHGSVEDAIPAESTKENKDCLNSCYNEDTYEQRSPITTAQADAEEENILNSRPLSVPSSSFNDNFTDFTGVPDDYLGQFEDILPPLPPLLSGGEFLMSPMDNKNVCQTSSSIPPSIPTTMTTSQTIDELLSEISDNFTLAGINDEVLTIAPPPSHEENNPLSSKAVMKNSKIYSLSSSNTHSQPHPSDTSAKTSGFNNTTVGLEITSSADQEFDDNHDVSLNNLQNTLVANKSSNNFMGLTEFDEAKIPDLPDELNPNIEDQYNITFEECFIPTLTAEQGSKDNKFVFEKTHLLLPNESNALDTTANETFSDCLDERDPLSGTCSEQTNICDTSADGDGYESAVNDITRDGTANTTIEIDGKLTSMGNDNESQLHEPPSISVDFEDEPMDVDLNATIEIIHKSAENIQNVERVLHHAENVLQHLDEEKENIEKGNRMENIHVNKLEEKVIGSLAKQKESSKMTFVIKRTNATPDVAPMSSHLEIEQSVHDVSLNKSVEFAMNKVTSLSSECVINTVNSRELQTNTPTYQAESLENNKESKVALNNAMDSSISSNTSMCRTPTSTMNSTLSMNTSKGSLPLSTPTSPAFPIKQSQNSAYFPKSPKSAIGNSNKTIFLEKSDYVEKIDQRMILKPKALQIDATETNPSDIFQEPMPVTHDEQFLTDKTEQQKHSENKRLTFNVEHVSESTSLDIVFPTKTKSDTSRRTFCINDVSDTPSEPSEIAASESKHAPMLSFNVAINEVQPVSSYDYSLPMEIDVEEHTLQGTSNTHPDSYVSQKEDSHVMKDLTSTALTSTYYVVRDEDNQSLSCLRNKSVSPPLPIMQKCSESPALGMQNRSDSPSLSAMNQIKDSSSISVTNENISECPSTAFQIISGSPPIHKEQSMSGTSPPAVPELNNEIVTINQHSVSDLPDVKQEHILDPENIAFSNSYSSSSPPIHNVRKRAPIHGFDSCEILSAKEQSNTKIKDEKDEFVEKLTPSPLEHVFSVTSTTLSNTSFGTNSTASPDVNIGGESFDDDFQVNSNVILNPFDFDYLLTKGNSDSNAPVDRSSLLLKFDPLLGLPVPSNQGQQQAKQPPLHLQIPTNTLSTNPCLSPTIEEDEHNESTNRSFVVENSSSDNNKVKSSLLCGLGRVTAGSASSLAPNVKSLKDRSQEGKQHHPQQQAYQNTQTKRQLPQPANKKNATMSVDVIKDMNLDNNDCNKTFEHSNSTQPDDKQINYKMDELEKKIKNEVLKTEDIEKKLKDAEQREEALIKRITEKDKTVAKMTGVIEAYEKAIAELIAEKEQLIQNYEKQLAEVKADRDSNYHHLTSLETTFSDLHVKYEKSKEMTCQLKGNEETLVTENRKNLENLRLQEQRYDKMKNHAMQQLEIANNKLECLTREHTMEITKLKALLKKEEIARSSMSEQLAQKTKENTELVKICDELIQGQGS